MAVSLTAREAPGRGCTCCPDHPPRRKDLMRRATRRTQRQAWKDEARRDN